MCLRYPCYVIRAYWACVCLTFEYFKMAPLDDDQRFSQADMFRLIALYRREGTLWNMSAPDYHNKEARNEAIQRITTNMDGAFTGEGASQNQNGWVKAEMSALFRVFLVRGKPPNQLITSNNLIHVLLLTIFVDMFLTRPFASLSQVPGSIPTRI